MPFKHPPLCGLTLCAATLTLFLAAAPNGVFAAELDQPQFSEQDAWVYHYKTEKGGSIEESDVDVSIIRSDGDEILVGFKVVGSTHPPREIMYKSDWSHSRGINGAETLVERPFAFPLAIGKAWRVEYTEDNPNVQHAREHLEIPYRVVGWEDVKTAAGKFKALKIEAKGSWTADVLPRTQSNAAIVQNNGQRTLLTQNNVQAARRAEGRIYRSSGTFLIKNAGSNHARRHTAPTGVDGTSRNRVDGVPYRGRRRGRSPREPVRLERRRQVTVAKGQPPLLPAKRGEGGRAKRGRMRVAAAYSSTRD
jgi:hypothetical protein